MLLADWPACQEAGCLVTIGSDDLPMFSTTLNREYEIAAALASFDERGIAEPAKNGVVTDCRLEPA